MEGNINPENDEKRSVVKAVLDDIYNNLNTNNDTPQSGLKTDLDNLLTELQKSIKPNVFSILDSCNGINPDWASQGTSLSASETRNILDMTGKLRLLDILLFTDYKSVEVRAYGTGANDLFVHPFNSPKIVYDTLGYEDWLANWELILYDTSNNKYVLWRLFGRNGGMAYNGEVKVDLYNADPNASHNAYVYMAYEKQASEHLYFKDYTKLKYRNMDIHRAIMKVLGLKFGDITVERRTKIEEKKKGWDFDIYIHKDMRDKEIEMVKEVIKKITSVAKKNIEVDEL